MDFRLVDAGAAFMAGREKRDERIKQNRLAGLAAQAYSAAPGDQEGLVRQAIALDPQAGYAIGGQSQQATQGREQRVGKLATILSGAPEQMRPQLYRQMLPELRRIGLQAPDQYDASVAQVVSQLATVYGGQSGAQTPSEIRTLQMLQANPDLLAINDRFRGQKSFKEVTNPDGSKSYVALDNRTGSGDFAPIGQPSPQPSPQPMPQQTASGSPNMDALAQAANAMIAAGIAPEQVDAIIMQAAQGTQGVQVQPPGMVPAGGPPVAPQTAPAPSRGLPSIMDIGGGEPGFRPQGLGQTDRDRAGAAAQKAAAVEAAKIAAQQAAAPRQAALDAEREAAITSARTGATNQAKRDAVQATNNTAFAQYTAARDTLLADLKGTVTGPLAGRLPAVTESQQIAEGAQARMAPILKGLFRTAGEGTFTDKDQELLMAMVPTRTDLPGAVEAKIAGIDAIIQAKLQQAPAQSADAPPVEGARKAPDGNWYVQRDGRYFKVEP